MRLTATYTADALQVDPADQLRRDGASARAADKICIWRRQGKPVKAVEQGMPAVQVLSPPLSVEILVKLKSLHDMA